MKEFRSKLHNPSQPKAVVSRNEIANIGTIIEIKREIAKS